VILNELINNKLLFYLHR